MPVVLPTDFLFFVLLAALFAYVLYVIRQPMLSRSWRKLGRSRSAVVSLTVIFFYLLVALLDSLHFKPSPAIGEGDTGPNHQVMSVFDVVVTPLRTRHETSYSAPFSALPQTCLLYTSDAADE